LQKTIALLGCVFAARCPYRFERCSEVPPLRDRVGAGHLHACHLSLDVRPALRLRSTTDEAVGQ
jgi:ABC-type antimicrobial peptide transport system ATPase subunit